MKKLIISFLLILVLFIVACNTSETIPFNNSSPVDSNVPDNNVPIVDYKSDDGCYVQNCHFSEINDVSCGTSNEPKICTQEFQPTDPCGAYATCKLVNNECVPKDNTRYNECITCVGKCVNIAAGNYTRQDECTISCY